MTRSRWIGIVAALLVLCTGLARFIHFAASKPTSSDRGVASGNRSKLGDMADKLDASSKVTYTAEYKMRSGTTATVVQQPPNVAFAGPSGRFIFTRDAVYRCPASTQPATCAKAKNTADAVDLNTDGLIPSWIGQEFVTTKTAAFTLLAAATLGSNYMVEDRGEQTIAGLHSTCLDVTSLLPDSKFYLGLGAFGLCVADNGVLTSFDGAGDRGDVGVELTSYADTADATAFQPPAGYRVVTVASLTPPSASPSASPSTSPSA